MLTIKYHSSFKKDYKRIVKRGCDISLLERVIETLASGEKLAEKHRDHELVGNYEGFRECHILPNWLLIYRIDGDELVLCLSRTGSHSDLFAK